MTTLSELGDEYLEAAHQLDEMIARKRAELKHACGNQLSVLLHDLHVLIDMQLETLHTSAYLKTYYRLSEVNNDRTQNE